MLILVTLSLINLEVKQNKNNNKNNKKKRKRKNIYVFLQGARTKLLGGVISSMPMLSVALLLSALFVRLVERKQKEEIVRITTIIILKILTLPPQQQVSLKGNELNHGLLLIAQMSSEGSMCKGAYTEATTKIAKENNDFVIGYICQEELGDPRFLHCTPGVKVYIFRYIIFLSIICNLRKKLNI